MFTPEETFELTMDATDSFYLVAQPKLFPKVGSINKLPKETYEILVQAMSNALLFYEQEKEKLMQSKLNELKAKDNAQVEELILEENQLKSFNPLDENKRK